MQWYVCLLANGQPSEACNPWQQDEVQGVAPQCPTCGSRMALPVSSEQVADSIAGPTGQVATPGTAVEAEPASAPVATLEPQAGETPASAQPEPLVTEPTEPNPTEAVDVPSTQGNSASDGVPADTQSFVDADTGQVQSETTPANAEPAPVEPAAQEAPAESATAEPVDDFVVPGATIPETIPEQVDEGDAAPAQE